MNYKSIEIESRESVSILWLNRPERRNALNATTLSELYDAITTLSDDPQVRVVVIMGRGKVFCAGADLSEPYAPGINNAQELIEQQYKPIFEAITQSDKTFISAVNGTAAGAGASLALACDLTLMSETSSLIIAFSNMALVPDCGASWLLTRQLGYKHAFRAAIEGQKLSAQRCIDTGLCNELFPEDELLTSTIDLAAQLASRAPLAVKLTKQLMRQSEVMSFEEIISLEAQAQTQCEQSADFEEARAAFLEKRTPRFLGY